MLCSQHFLYVERGQSVRRAQMDLYFRRDRPDGGAAALARVAKAEISQRARCGGRREDQPLHHREDRKPQTMAHLRPAIGDRGEVASSNWSILHNICVGPGASDRTRLASQCQTPDNRATSAGTTGGVCGSFGFARARPRRALPQSRSPLQSGHYPIHPHRPRLRRRAQRWPAPDWATIFRSWRPRIRPRSRPSASWLSGCSPTETAPTRRPYAGPTARRGERQS